ncbi:MAG: DUF2029 domain-containing protein [Acidobacteria bacterium]|nr:DUF2029 domain-containing protein [Acidobacteriota bacterium]
MKRRGIPLWYWFLLAVACFRYVQRNLFLAPKLITGSWSDFTHYYLAARALLHGVSPYTVYNFDYPPLVAFLVLPLAPLHYLTARLAWFWLNQLFIAGAAYVVWRISGRDRVATLSVAVTWSLCGTVAENLVLGQVNGLLVLLLALAMAEHRRGSVSLGLATAVKLWPAVLTVRDLFLGRVRQFLVAVAVAAGFVVGPMGLIAVMTNGSPWPHSGSYWMGSPAVLNFSLPATVLRIADPPRSDGAVPAAWTYGDDPRRLHLSVRDAMLSVTAAVFTMATGLGILFAVTRRYNPSAAALTGALVPLALAASPIAWYHYQLLQLPGIAWIGARSARRRKIATLGPLILTTIGLTWAHRFDFFLDTTARMVLIRGASVVALDFVLFFLFLRTMADEEDG